jgi:hypothetical protein
MRRLIIDSKHGRLRRVALSTALLGGALATVGAFSSPAHASTDATKTTTAKYTISCAAGIVGTGTETVAATNVYPASVVHGTTFKITWHSVTTVSKTQDEAAWALGARSFKGKVTTIDYLSSDATPKSLNVAGTKGIPTGGNLIGPPNYGSPLIYTPLKGSPPAVTPLFKAGAKGTDTVKPGVDDASLTLYSGTNGTGTAIATVTANCSAPSTPTVIASVPVS